MWQAHGTPQSILLKQYLKLEFQIFRKLISFDIMNC